MDKDFGRYGMPNHLAEFLAANVDSALRRAWSNRSLEIDRDYATYNLVDKVVEYVLMDCEPNDRRFAATIVEHGVVNAGLRIMCAKFVDAEISSRRQQWISRSREGVLVRLKELDGYRGAILSYQPPKGANRGKKWVTKFADDMTANELEIMFRNKRTERDRADKETKFLERLWTLTRQKMGARTLGEAIDRDMAEG